MDEQTLMTFDGSLGRCGANGRFMDRFYEIFLASSPKVKEKFANTDFVRQKRALRASLHLMLLATGDGQGGAEKYLRSIADRHGRKDLSIGSELYDYWLDSLLAAVKECDPQYSTEVHDAWERVMMTGISYLLSQY